MRSDIVKLVIDLLFLSGELTNVELVRNLIKHFRPNSLNKFQVYSPSAKEGIWTLYSSRVYMTNTPQPVPLNHSFDQCFLHSNIGWVLSKLPLISILYWGGNIACALHVWWQYGVCTVSRVGGFLLVEIVSWVFNWGLALSVPGANLYWEFHSYLIQMLHISTTLIARPWTRSWDCIFK